jgi:pyruvate formate lyase activating enzyme
LKDKAFYETGGGVTFSGGEALLQFEKIEPLLKKLKSLNINICVETACSVPQKFVDIALKYIDEFIIDIKILDEDTIFKINGNLKNYKKNIEEIFNSNKKVIFRIPLAKDYIVTENNIKLILEFLSQFRPYKVEIFKIHNLAQKKYETLNKDMVKLKDISSEEIEKIKCQIENLGIKVEICKI